MSHHHELYIEGQWISSTSTDLIDVLNPTTEQIIAAVPDGTSADVDKAVDAAHRAVPGWSSTPAAERADWLHRIHRGLSDRAEEIAQLVSAEVGMPIGTSRVMQAGFPIANFAAFAELARAYAFEGEEVGNSLVVKDAIGVAAAITPWNYPLHQVALKVAPALAAGCTVVLKPSEIAPLSAYLLAEVIDAIGLPAGVFNLVSGAGAVVGEALAAHPKVGVISFTGSTRAGRRVAELAAASVKRVALELGGKSANVILPGVDLERAVTAGVQNCYLNSGQTCTAYTRMLVPRESLARVEQIAADTASRFQLGDPIDESTTLGPVVSKGQQDRVRGYIRDGIAEGAKLIIGGPDIPMDQGYFIAPTIFSEVKPGMKVEREEIFGPVLSIIPYDTEDEAVEIANDTVYGLAGAVWAETDAQALAVARRMQAGQIEVNGGSFNLGAPFGGFKQSGIGREGGIWGLEEFLETKALQR